MTANPTEAEVKAARLLAVLEAASDEAMRSVLPWVVFPLLGALPHDELPASVVEFFDGFSARLGVAQTTTPDELRAILDAYRREHPVDARLMADLLAVARDELTGAPDDEVGRAFARLIDAEPGRQFLVRSMSGEPVDG